MQARMKNPALVLPGVLEHLSGLGKVSAQTKIPAATLKLVDVRASQINGCSLCLDMHCYELRKMGESDERLFAVAAWRESPYFNDAERAALALTEALTRLCDREDAVPDAVWQEASRHYDERALAALVVQIGKINLWNRINVATRQPANSWREFGR